MLLPCPTPKLGNCPLSRIHRIYIQLPLMYGGHILHAPLEHIMMWWQGVHLTWDQWHHLNKITKAKIVPKTSVSETLWILSCILGLFWQYINCEGYTASNGKLIKNDELGKMWLWPMLRYYPNIFLDGLRKSMKNLSQQSGCPNWVTLNHKRGIQTSPDYTVR
jgi:hypothetical protein